MKGNRLKEFNVIIPAILLIFAVILQLCPLTWLNLLELNQRPSIILLDAQKQKINLNITNLPKLKFNSVSL